MKEYRKAFTLLEALIALSLVTVLMALSWSLFATFSRLENRARKTVAGLEITRSLRRQLQNDLDQLVNFNLRPELNDSASANPLELALSASGETDSESVGLEMEIEPSLLTQKIQNATESSDGTSADILPTASFFEGDSQSVAFLIQSNGGTPFFDSKEEFLVVSYEWRGNPEDRNDNNEELELELNDLEPSNQETVKREFVRTVMTYRDYQSKSLRRQVTEDGDDANQAESIEFETITVGQGDKEKEGEQPTRELLDRIPEVAEVEFRYFDGRSWNSRWSNDSLPVAIEVVFKVEVESDTASQQDSSEEDELEFGSEIEIGDSERSEESESSLREFDLEDDEIKDFDPESKRILIRIGTHFSSRRQVLNNDPELDFNNSLLEEVQ